MTCLVSAHTAQSNYFSDLIDISVIILMTKSLDIHLIFTLDFVNVFILALTFEHTCNVDFRFIK